MRETYEPEGAEGSIELLRSTARWWVSSAAAVAAVLITGFSLSTLRALSWSQWIGVVVALATALCAVGWVVHSAATVLTIPVESQRSLAERITKASRELVTRQDSASSVTEGDVAAEDPVLLEIYEQRAGLFGPIGASGLDEALKKRKAAADGWAKAPADVAKRDEWLQVEVTIRHAGRVGQLVRVRTAYLALTRHALPGAAAALLCALLVLGGLTATQQAEIEAPRTATQARVFLDDRLDRSSVGLGDECVAKELDGVIVGGTLQEPIVAFGPTNEGCEPAQVRVRPGVGVAVPR